MISFKYGVVPKDLSPQMLLAIQVAADIFAWKRKDCVITSLNDAKHKEGSKHYEGRAVDLRVKHLEPQMKKTVFVEIKTALQGCPDYLVLFEDEGTPNEHIHIQYNG